MSEGRRDGTKVDPLTGAEEERPAQPLETVPEGQSANATTATIPGTGKAIKGDDGEEVKRVVTT